MDMPPLHLLVLDGLADDLETVETLRNHGDTAPDGLALVDEQAIVAALREMLAQGLVAAFRGGHHPLGPRLAPEPSPTSDDASIRSYWFKQTAEGERVWRSGAEVLDAYWNADPDG